jgi:hypothetical protein
VSAGGLAGTSSASVLSAKLTIDGVIKSEVSEGVIAGESKAGGAFGINNGPLDNVLITLKNDVIATYKGSVAGVSGAQLGANVWVLLSNSIGTDVSTSANSGYNSLKIVGEASFKSSFDENDIISFELMTSTTYLDNWYYDISEGVSLSADIYNNGYLFTPDRTLSNMKYHVSFY